MSKVSNCIVCGTGLTGRQSKFCSSSCKNRYHQCYDAQYKRGLERKLHFVEEMGGCCSMCGYHDNLAALTFHHQTADKNFKLDARSLSNRTITSISCEARKCILVCANCHAQLHYPHLDLANLLVF